MNQKLNMRRVTLHGIRWEIVPTPKPSGEGLETSYIFRNGRRVGKITAEPAAIDAEVVRMAQEEFEYAMSCGTPDDYYIIID